MNMPRRNRWKTKRLDLPAAIFYLYSLSNETMALCSTHLSGSEMRVKEDTTEGIWIFFSLLLEQTRHVIKIPQDALINLAKLIQIISAYLSVWNVLWEKNKTSIEIFKQRESVGEEHEETSGVMANFVYQTSPTFQTSPRFYRAPPLLAIGRG